MYIDSYANIVRKRISRLPMGSVFVAEDFADIAENSRIGVILSRLEKKQSIRRVMHGIYDKPEYNTFLHEYLAPFPDQVARALARKFGWTIAPSGDTALNLLGLSTQVPAVWSYVSDGGYKKITYNNTTILFRKTMNREISNLSCKTAMVVQALKSLGRTNVTHKEINNLRMKLSVQERKQMLEEARYVTSWVYEYMKKICRSDVA